MDPFVPEPEEREAHQQTLPGKPRGRNGGERPGPLAAASLPGDWRQWALRFGPAALLLALVLVQYGIQASSIRTLESKLASLDAPAASRPAPSASSPARGDLEAALDEQADLIRTLEQRIATQIIDLDSLRETTSARLSSLGAAPIDKDAAALAKASDVEALKGDIARLRGQLAATEKALAANQAGASKALDTAVAGIKTALGATDKRIDSLATTQESALKQQQSRLDDRIAQLAARLDQTSPQLAGLEKSLADGREAQRLALASATKEQQAALEAQRSALMKALDSAIAKEVKPTIASLEERVVAVDKAREADSAALDTRLAGVDKMVAERLAKEREALDGTLAALQRDLAATGRRLEGIDKSVAALDPLQPRLAALEDGLASLRGETDSRIAAAGKTGANADKRLDAIEARLDATRKALADLKQLPPATGNVAIDEKQVEARISQRIDSRLEPQVRALAEQADKVAALETTLATQGKDIDALAAASKRQGGELAALDGGLDEVRATLAASEANAAALVDSAELTAFLGAVGRQMTQLERKIDATATLIAEQESRMADWRNEVDNRTVGLVKASATGGDGVKPLERQLAEQRAAIDRLETRNQRLEDGLAATTGALETLRASRAEPAVAKGADLAPLEKQLASQLATLEALRADNSALAKDLADTNAVLASLRQRVEQARPATSAGNGASAAQFASADGARLDQLSARLDGVGSRLSRQEATLAEWRQTVERRIAAAEQQATRGDDGEKNATSAELDTIWETLALLQKQHPFVDFPAR
ncbi:MAG TPA: hypothetical protein VK018_08040 [Porticoccaceae bacterium]|nr:hypothetical protein [Porticoccaceae bacterium]